MPSIVSKLTTALVLGLALTPGSSISSIKPLNLLESEKQRDTPNFKNNQSFFETKNKILPSFPFSSNSKKKKKKEQSDEKNQKLMNKFISSYMIKDLKEFIKDNKLVVKEYFENSSLYNPFLNFLVRVELEILKNEEKNFKIAKILLDAKANIYVINDMESMTETPCSYVFRTKNNNKIKKLFVDQLAKDNKINEKIENKEKKPINYAIEIYDTSTVGYLMEKGAKLNGEEIKKWVQNSLETKNKDNFEYIITNDNIVVSENIYEEVIIPKLKNNLEKYQEFIKIFLDNRPQYKENIIEAVEKYLKEKTDKTLNNLNEIQKKKRKIR